MTLAKVRQVNNKGQLGNHYKREMLKSVSYTHLDVYKRQVKPWLASQCKLSSSENPLLADDAAGSGDTAPVDRTNIFSDCNLFC